MSAVIAFFFFTGKFGADLWSWYNREWDDTGIFWK